MITGASGFIGGFLVEEALRRGYEVWAGVRKNSDLSRLRDKRIRLIDLKYNDTEALAAQVKEACREGKWDYVIHNAGLTKTTDKRNFHLVNTVNTRNLVEALAAAGCHPRKFLLMSSLSAVVTPQTAYGKSKLEAESFLRGQKHFPHIILRPTGVYGPGEKDYFLEIKSIRAGFDFTVGMTPQRITFIYVKDLARVAFLALEKEEVLDKSYFVADGDTYTDTEYARMIREALGKKCVLRMRIPTGLVYIACAVSEWFGKRIGKSVTLNTDKYIILKHRDWTCDITPLRDDLHFQPEYPLPKGLKESIAWYKEAGWLR